VTSANGSGGRPLANRSRASGCELAETNGLGVRFKGRGGGAERRLQKGPKTRKAAEERP